MKKTDRKNKTERLFIALVPGKDALSAITTQVETIKGATWAKAVRFLPEDSLHMTMRFLGDTDQKTRFCLDETLALSLKNEKPFSFTLSHVLFLPSPSRARVMAVGAAPCPQLESLAETIEKAVVRCGFEPEKRRFKAHITLGRCKDTDARLFSIQADFGNISVPVTSVKLMRSTLTGNGAIYDPMNRFEFRPLS